MNDRSILDLLAEHAFTSGLGIEDRRLLADLTTTRSYQPGELLIQEGQPATAFFLVVSGRIAIEVYLKGGETRHLQTVVANSAIGWSWLVPPYRWEFDARALEPSTAIVVDAQRLRDLFGTHCTLGLHLTRELLAVVADRLKSTRLQLLDLYAPSRGGSA